jgi:hypothetical protein
VAHYAPRRDHHGRRDAGARRSAGYRLLKPVGTHDINVIAYTAKMNVDDAPATRVFAEVLRSRPARRRSSAPCSACHSGEPEAAMHKAHP